MSRGIAAYAALERHLASKDGSGLVRERYPAASGDNAYSYEWPYSQVHIAALDLAAVDALYAAEVAERAKAQEHYWNAGGTTEHDTPWWAPAALPCARPADTTFCEGPDHIAVDVARSIESSSDSGYLEA
ncbi:hypothetical protein [Streptomyces mirabilis]|uniref:hypothetical protein n=1 Tax=Streptomyces mirabilis TaxID=68239 RepID=UPI0036A3985F